MTDRPRRLPVWQRALIFAPPLIVAAVLIIAGVGPNDWFFDRRIGALVTLLACVVPMLFLNQWLTRRNR